MDEIQELIEQFRNERKEHFYNTDSNAGEVAFNNCATLLNIIELLIKNLNK
jgi:hypothetical protein